MLDEKDLLAIQRLIEHSESRMMGRMDKLDARMDKLDARMDQIDSRMDQIDSRMDKLDEKIDGTRSQIMAYLETAIEPKLRALAEGHQNLFDSKASNARVDKLEEELATQKSLIMVLSEEVSQLKKAQ